jgi:plasmid stability protein
MEEERELLRESLKPAEEQAQRFEAQAKSLRQQLEAERTKTFWQRLFSR